MGLLKKAVSATTQKANELAQKAKAENERKKEEERLRKEENERKFREKFPFTRMYQIKSGTVEISGGYKRTAYFIIDEQGNTVYTARGTFWMENYHFVFVDANKKTVAHIRKHLFNFGWSFVKERTGCTMWLEDKSFRARLTTYLFMKEREFGSTEETISVKLEDIDKLKRDKVYKVSKHGCGYSFSKVYRVRSDEGFLSNKYIVGFNKEEDALLASLVAIAINTIRFEVY